MKKSQKLLKQISKAKGQQKVLLHEKMLERDYKGENKNGF